MPVFRCEVMGVGGDGQTHQVEAATADEARRLLGGKGLFVTKVIEVRKSAEQAEPVRPPAPKATHSSLESAVGQQFSADEPLPDSEVRWLVNGEQLVLYVPPSSAVYEGPFQFIVLSFVAGLLAITAFAVFGGLGLGEARFFVPILGFLWLFGLGGLYIWLRGRFGKTCILIEPGRLVRCFTLFGWKRTREYALDGSSYASLVADWSFQYGGTAGLSGWGWLSGRGKPVFHVHVTTADVPPPPPEAAQEVVTALKIAAESRRANPLIRSLLTASTIAAFLCGCGEGVYSPTAVPADEPQAEDAPSAAQWVDSDDRTLALRLSAPSEPEADGVSIKITAQIRNNGQTPITILRPFGDWYLAKAVGIKIWDDKRRIRYSGPNVTYVIGADAFAVVEPGETVEDRIELSTDNFAGIEQPGTYSWRYDYSYDGRWDATAAAGESGIAGAWRGTICSREVQVTRR